MTRPIKALLITGFAALTVAAIAVGAFVWRIQRAPIELNWLRPRIEQAIRDTGFRPTVSMGSVQMWWAADERGLELRAIDVRVSDDVTGRSLALPAVAVQPKLAPLLRGRVALSRLTLIGPRLALMHTEDGFMPSTASGEVAPTADAAPLRTFVTDLRQLLTVVGQVQLREGEIAVDDRTVGQIWGIRNTQATLALDGDRLGASIETHLYAEALRIPARLSAHHSPDDGISATVAFDELTPAQLVRASPEALRSWLPAPAQRVAAAIASPLDAQISLTVDPETTAFGPIHITARGEHLSLVSDEPQFSADGATLHLAAAIDPGTDVATITELKLGLRDTSIALTGTVRDVRRARLVDVRATAGSFPVQALERYWPPSLAPGARRWVIENISGGEIRELIATAQTSLAAPAPVGSGFNLRARFDGLTVRFAPDMPPATAVGGRVTASIDGASFSVAQGQLAALEISGGKVEVLPRTAAAAPRVSVDVDVRGPIAAALEVLQHEPVRIADTLKLPPQQVDGSLDARVHCDVPIGAGDSSPPTFSARARLESVALLEAVNGRTINNGDLTVQLEGQSLDAEGHVDVNGVPVLVRAQHRIGTAAAPQVGLQARLDPSARAALGMDLGGWISGTLNATAHLTPVDTKTWQVDADVDLTETTFQPPVAAFGKAAGRTGRATARLFISDGKLARIERFDVDAGGTRASGSSEHTADGQRQSIRAQVSVPTATKKQHVSPVEVVAQRRDDAGYTLSLRSQDAGAILNLVLLGTVRGGVLAFDGAMRPADPGMPLHGHLEITDLRVTKAPVLAELLQVGSLRGLMSTFRREGLRFERIRGDLAYQNGIVRITNGRAQGEGTVFVVEGPVDTNTSELDLHVSVIPSYYGLNTVTQKIPLLGSLVSKATGEALQVIDTRISGPIADPKVSIAPVSMLTPEIVKETIDYWRTPRGGRAKQ